MQEKNVYKLTDGRRNSDFYNQLFAQFLQHRIRSSGVTEK